MSDFLQAIDVITKLLPQIKSLTGARRREYFNEIFAPLFTSLETVHDFYHELFLDTRQEIVTIGWGSQIFLANLTEPLSKKQLAALRRLWSAYERKRRKDMRLRDDLRHDARQLLARISWPEERAFLVALGDYFLGDREPPLTYKAIELQASNVVRYGGDSHWSTPSSELYLALSESINLTSTLSALDEMRHRLNERYMNVRLTFKTVQHSIIERT